MNYICRRINATFLCVSLLRLFSVSWPAHDVIHVILPRAVDDVRRPTPIIPIATQ